jgi:hypothetical protein
VGFVLGVVLLIVCGPATAVPGPRCSKPATRGDVAVRHRTAPYEATGGGPYGGGRTWSTGRSYGGPPPAVRTEALRPVPRTGAHRPWARTGAAAPIPGDPFRPTPRRRRWAVHRPARPLRAGPARVGGDLEAPS